MPNNSMFPFIEQIRNMLTPLREYEPDLPQVFARSTVLVLGYTLMAVLVGRITTHPR